MRITAQTPEPGLAEKHMGYSNSINLRNLSHADLRRTVKVCEQLHLADPAEPFLPQCHAIIGNAVSSVHASMELYAANPFSLSNVVNLTITPYWMNIFTQYLPEHPYVARLMGPKKSHLEAIQFEPTLKEFKTTSLYNEFYTKVQGQNLLWIAHRDSDELLSFAYLREKEYCEAELAILQIIQPHLETAWKNWKRANQLKQELDLLKGAIFQTEEEEAAAARIRKAIDTLTQRQRTIVECVATGMDNQQIADEFKISMLTVKKHLQMIFKQLDIQHRTQLAAKWHQAHSVSLY